MFEILIVPKANKQGSMHRSKNKQKWNETFKKYTNTLKTRFEINLLKEGWWKRKFRDVKKNETWMNAIVHK
jgi:hypothetical protein